MSLPTAKTLQQIADIFTRRSDAERLRASTPDEWFACIVLANRDRHRLVPALHQILRETSLSHALPDDVRAYLAGCDELNAERNIALAAEIGEIIALLNAAGVRPMLLKGAASLFDPARALAGRMIGDIDMLVPPQQAPAASACLRQAGFTSLKLGALGHTIGDFDRRGNLACLDLHWELLDPPYQKLLPAAAARTRARECTQNGRHYTLPALQDHARYTLLHAQVHHPGYYSRHLCLGLARELAALHALLDWAALAAWSRRHGMGAVLEASLLAAGEFFGLAWPLTQPASAVARQHHRRCREVEITGCWDAGLTPLARLRETFARDRLAVSFASDGPHIVNIGRFCWRSLRRRPLQKLFGRSRAP